jgi:hypothetical protein
LDVVGYRLFGSNGGMALISKKSEKKKKKKIFFFFFFFFSRHGSAGRRKQAKISYRISAAGGRASNEKLKYRNKGDESQASAISGNIEKCGHERKAWKTIELMKENESSAGMAKISGR